MPAAKAAFPGHQRPHRVLFYAGGFAPMGGIESFTADLASELAYRGWDIHLHGWDTRSPEIPRLQAAGAHVHLLPWRWGCRWGLPDWFALPVGVARARKSQKVVLGKTFSPTVHKALARHAKLPGLDGKFVLITPYRPAEFWKEPRPDGAEHAPATLLQNFSQIICQTDVFARDLRALGYGGPVEIIPYLPPAFDLNPAPFPDNGFTLGFLGRIEKQKNLPALFQIFQHLSRKVRAEFPWIPPPRLRLFGSGSQTGALRRLAAQLGLQRLVEFNGPVDRSHLDAAVRGCHVFCLTSLTEGQSLATLEILARGRPLIAFGVGALPEVLTHHDLGTVVTPGDVEAFVNALLEVFLRQNSGTLGPGNVVRAYRAAFNRDGILQHYMRVLGPGQT